MMQRLPEGPSGLLTLKGWKKATAGFDAYGPAARKGANAVTKLIQDLNKAWSGVPWAAFRAEGQKVADPAELDALASRAATDWKKVTGALARKVDAVVRSTQDLARVIDDAPAEDKPTQKSKPRDQRTLTEVLGLANETREGLAEKFDDEDFRALKAKLRKGMGLSGAIPAEGLKELLAAIQGLERILGSLRRGILRLGTEAEAACAVVDRYDDATPKPGSEDAAATAKRAQDSSKELTAAITRLARVRDGLEDTIADVAEALERVDGVMDEVEEGGDKLVARVRKQVEKAGQHRERLAQMVERTRALEKLLKNVREIIADGKSVAKVRLPEVDVGPLAKELDRLTALVKDLKKMK
jgi:methyl-accepting chemotaxis protein